MLAIRLPAEMEQRLTVPANATQRTNGFYVRKALERSLEDIEDAYFAETAKLWGCQRQ